MPTYWKLAKPFRDHRITNALQLANAAGIGYPAATRIWKAHTNSDALGRFDFATLDKLAATFGVKPLALLTDTPKR